jgi:Protein of unknown function (DUF3551)
MLMRQYFDSSPRFILKINVCELLSVVVANNEARLLLLDGPGRREAATSQWGFRLIEVLSGVPDAALLLDVRGTRAVKFVLVIFGILSASAAQAQNAPWCLQSSALDGSLRCTYATFEQCLVDRQAKNGFCTQNSTYQASSPSIRRR